MSKITLDLNDEFIEQFVNKIQPKLIAFQPESEEVFNRNQAAQFLKISKPTLDKLVAKKEIPYMILGDQKRFVKSDLLNLGRN
jgi:excisionase family DNA binding protein